MYVKFWWESQKEGDHYEDLDVGLRIIILEKWDRVVRTEFIWLRIGTSVRLLQTQ
jgi:hypothetical protein